MTENVYEELDDAKAEIEKLKSDYRVNSDLCDNLKRSNADLLKRIKELNLKLEKQDQEIEAKTDEGYAANQSVKDLNCKLKEKDNIIKSLNSANDKLRVDFNSKLHESEDEKIKLASSLEEAIAKISNLEHENRVFMDKIEVLKEGILSVSQKKCANESKIAKASKQMRETGDMFEKVEEEKRKLGEQFKWKNEQFKHLEEAHKKLKDNIRAKENEWNMEKSTFFDDISTLETKLDSQIKLSEDLKKRLETCKQALNQEKDRRKRLEGQLSEFVETKSNLESLTNEKERVCKQMKRKIVKLEEENQGIVETKSKLESLTNEKECVCNELKCKIVKLEEENQELVFSLKQVKESKIQDARNASLIAKLQKEIKKAVKDLNFCKLELESKEASLKKITTDLDDYNFIILQLTIEKEVMKSTLLDFKIKCDEEKLLLHKEVDSHKKQVKNVCDLLAQSYCEVNEVEFELQIWKSVAENLKVNLEVNHQMRKELEASLLAQVAIEVNLKEESSNLVYSLQEKDRKINDLEQKIKKENVEKLEKWEKEWVTKELEAAILAQLESERIHEHEKQNLNQVLDEKDKKINNLQKIMTSLEEEFNRSTVSFSSKLSKMQSEMDLFHESWEKIKTTLVLKEIEVQEKGLMIIELEKDLQKQVKFVKKCLLSVKKLSSENENLMGIIGNASEWINKLSREDGQVMGTLRGIMSSFDGLKDDFDPVKENVCREFSSPKRNLVEKSVDDRSPLRTLNG